MLLRECVLVQGDRLVGLLYDIEGGSLVKFVVCLLVFVLLV